MRIAGWSLLLLLTVAGCKKSPPPVAEVQDLARTSIFEAPHKVKQELQQIQDDEEKRRDRKIEEMAQ
jgi:hypothetical protein